MFTKRKDEYQEATEHASINTHAVGKKRSLNLGIFNLFLLTTIGVMGYVGFDSWKEERSLNRDRLLLINENKNETREIHLEVLEDKNNLDSLSLEINSIVESCVEDNSLYIKALTREIGR